MEARLRPILYRIAVSLGLMKPYSLHHPLAQSHSLSSFPSPLSSIQSVPLSSIQGSLLYAEPVSVLSHCVSVGSVPDACGYRRFVSLTISPQ